MSLEYTYRKVTRGKVVLFHNTAEHVRQVIDKLLLLLFLFPWVMASEPSSIQWYTLGSWPFWFSSPTVEGENGAVTYQHTVDWAVDCPNKADNTRLSKHGTHLVDLSNGWLTGENGKVTHEVLFLSFEQLCVVHRMQRFLPEWANVHASYFGRRHGFTKGPEKRAVSVAHYKSRITDSCHVSNKWNERRQQQRRHKRELTLSTK